MCAPNWQQGCEAFWSESDTGNIPAAVPRGTQLGAAALAAQSLFDLLRTEMTPNDSIIETLT